jgi:hypothetical protein
VLSRFLGRKHHQLVFSVPLRICVRASTSDRSQLPPFGLRAGVASAGSALPKTSEDFFPSLSFSVRISPSLHPPKLVCRSPRQASHLPPVLALLGPAAAGPSCASSPPPATFLPSFPRSGFRLWSLPDPVHWSDPVVVSLPLCCFGGVA